jgi:sterol desaturase/sphingolipid hydroxylase (fatty acid hydroxylase superfamily)
VHHQSEDYNLTTALRQTSTGFLLSWIFYLPLAGSACRWWCSSPWRR